jgi:hypothetical protein
VVDFFFLINDKFRFPNGNTKLLQQEKNPTLVCLGGHCCVVFWLPTLFFFSFRVCSFFLKKEAEICIFFDLLFQVLGGPLSI